MVDDGPKPERISVLGHHFLFPASREKERRNIRMKLLRTGQVLPKSPDGSKEQLILIAIHQIIQGGNRKLHKSRVKHGGILGLDNKKAQDLQPYKCRTQKKGHVTH